MVRGTKNRRVQWTRPVTADTPNHETRVLQVVLSLNPGGTERLVIDIVKRLMPEMPMAVCCLDEIGAWGEELRAAGVMVSALKRPPGFVPSIGRGIASAAKQHRATVIHAHQYTPFVYSCLSRVWRRGTPIVFTEHGRLSDAPPSAKRRGVNRLLGRIPSAVVAVSEDLRQFMAAEGFAGARVDVIHNGIAVGPLPAPDEYRAIRAELRIPDDVMLVGTVARLDPVKDLGTLLRALAGLKDETQAAVVIVGDGPERSALERLTDDLTLRSRVNFLGHRHDARRWLAGCDVYVNASTSEGVSLTILEAMAAGLPVVATRVGGTPEVIDDASGILVPARDPAALAGAIRALAADRAKARALGLAGRARVEARFNVDRMVRTYADVYRRAQN